MKGNSNSQINYKDNVRHSRFFANKNNDLFPNPQHNNAFYHIFDKLLNKIFGQKNKNTNFALLNPKSLSQ